MLGLDLEAGEEEDGTPTALVVADHEMIDGMWCADSFQHRNH